MKTSLDPESGFLTGAPLCWNPGPSTAALKSFGNNETTRKTLLLKYWFSLLPRHPARSVSKTIGDFGEVLQKSFYMETSALPISLTCRPFKRIDEKHCCLTRFENNWLTWQIVSVSDDKTQITLLIVGRSALFRIDLKKCVWDNVFHFVKGVKKITVIYWKVCRAKYYVKDAVPEPGKTRMVTKPG